MNSSSFTMTDSAAQRIGQIVAREPGKIALRLAVNGGGCSGFQYEFTLVEAKAEDDIAIEKNGATLLIDEISAQYVEGSALDFVEDLMGASFRVTNPNATASCGCGTSFSL